MPVSLFAKWYDKIDLCIQREQRTPCGLSTTAVGSLYAYIVHP